MDYLQICFGLASLISFLYTLWPNFTHHEVKHRKIAWGALVCFLIASIAIYTCPWIESSTGVVSQSGDVEVSNRKKSEFEVFYPKKYSSIPNLSLKINSGSGEIDITDQRPDGFKFKIYEFGYISSDGGHIKWTAVGEK